MSIISQYLGDFRGEGPVQLERNLQFYELLLSIADGETVDYSITADVSKKFERGQGTINSAGELQRVTVSSNHKGTTEFIEFNHEHHFVVVKKKGSGAASNRQITFEGLGGIIQAGTRAVVFFNESSTLTGWQIASRSITTIEIDLWVNHWTTYPPNLSDTIISGSNHPKLVSQITNEDNVLADVSTSIPANSVMIVHVNSGVANNVVLNLRFA